MSKRKERIKNEYIQAGLSFARRHLQIAPHYGSDIRISSVPKENYDSLLETLVFKEEKFAKSGFKPIDFVELANTYGDNLGTMHVNHVIEKLATKEQPFMYAKYQQLHVQKYYLNLERDITFKALNTKKSSS